ncbi:hypothetical protein [Pseudomonas retamae]|uniref:Uncharacterized protein n=1 Tax=Pseudomonas retamae TaxID=702110 RepID=A0ABW7DG43_9PSED
MDRYWLKRDFLHGMQTADEDGFRWIVGRRFVDVEYAGGVETTHVGTDDAGIWHGKLLTERNPSGPRLYKNADRPTWRLSEQPATVPTGNAERLSLDPIAQKRPALAGTESTAVKQPRPADTPTYVDQSRYRPTSRSPDAQGYYEFMPYLSASATDIQFAFMDRFGKAVRIAPPAAGFGAEPAQFKHWTDREIWTLYGIDGADITRFRAEAEASGKPPDWVEARETINPHSDLLNNALRWLCPTLTRAQSETFLQSYNLLPSQLTRLRQELKTTLAMPQWAEAHKRLTEDLDNPQRLEQLSRDAAEELNLKRNAQHDWYAPESSLTGELREALLRKLGYLRNKHNCLYRTDVPGLFRGDERTPFELADDRTMLPRYHHEPGMTTHKPLSATFSLNEGQMYASSPAPEYLRYERQTNRYPGRGADEPSDSDTTDSESATSSDWSDPASPIPWDNDRHYRSTRQKQKQMFIYALDTRDLEVVPHEENMMFNSAARETPPTRFPSDDFEGLISVTRSGLAAERIWLLNSAQTKAARIDDIVAQAGDRAELIEAATRAGHANAWEYDRLIDSVEAAGLPIVRLSGNSNEFAYDIGWPDPVPPSSLT